MKRMFGLPAFTAVLMTTGIFSSSAIQASAQIEPVSQSTGCATAKRPLDYDGDGKTDLTVVRNTGGGQNGQITWFNNYSNGGMLATAFGIVTDFFVSGDFDGDGKSDITVWRRGSQAYFYIMQSQTNTFRADAFGQTGDDPTVVGDYTGDGKDDPAVYRAGASSGEQSFWYYRASSGPFAGQVVGNPWGQAFDFPAPGDYDGDGRYDFVVQRATTGSAGIFYLNQTTAGLNTIRYGAASDRIVPGDYDGDCKTDIAVVRGVGGVLNWFVRQSTDGASQFYQLGASATDFPTQGDYDGDGKIDIGVWRNSGTFYWRKSTDGTVAGQKWGQSGDFPPANFNSH